MSKEKTSLIQSVLSKTDLFQVFDNKQLHEISKHSELIKYDINSLVYQHSETEKSVPMMIVASGCIGVVYYPIYANTENIINALLMPNQVFGEFQFLGDRFPEGIKLKSFSKSLVVSIDSDYLEKFVEENALFYKALSKILVEKLNINNYHVFIRNFSNSFCRKLSFYLDSVGNHPVWKRALTNVNSNKYKIKIYWTVTTLGQYLSTKERSIGEQLAIISKAQAIEIIWYDEKYRRINNISNDDIANIGKVKAKLKFNTPFQIVVTNRNNLQNFYEK